MYIYIYIYGFTLIHYLINNEIMGNILERQHIKHVGSTLISYRQFYI
jgi:hypothetical protein